MKKINTNNVGRMPFWQSDLAWIQAGYTEPLEAIVEELGFPQSYFPITGCVPSKPNIKTLAMRAGWFWWNGEILPVRALQTTDVLSFTDPVVRLTKVTYFDTNGSRSFIKTDLSSQQVSNVWQDDYLTPEVVERSASFDSGVRLGIGVWTLRDILKRYIGDCESDWRETSNQYVQYKIAGKFVTIWGALINMSEAVTGLPQPEVYPLYIWENPSDTDHYLVITQNGEMVYNNPHNNSIPFSFALHVMNGFTYLAKNPYINYVDPNIIIDEE